MRQLFVSSATMMIKNLLSLRILGARNGVIKVMAISHIIMLINFLRMPGFSLFNLGIVDEVPLKWERY